MSELIIPGKPELVGIDKPRETIVVPFKTIDGQVVDVDVDVEEMFVAVYESISELMAVCHGLARKAGWYTDPATGENLPKDSMADKITGLMLCVSELAEGMEGLRKGDVQDDKLPQHKMYHVELVDCLIRLFDQMGNLGVDFGAITVDKLRVNLARADHKLENRAKDGGKVF